MSELSAAIASEIDPPAAPKLSKRSKRDPNAKKRGPARPYKKITDETLATRIKRLTDRMERAKKQHESARNLVTKYSHERLYRDKDAIEGVNETAPDTGIQA